ncbi:MAG TPA: TonB family protein [Polyangia bacterium]|nr:TonB family protein [Polyangia bacterium]
MRAIRPSLVVLAAVGLSAGVARAQSDMPLPPPPGKPRPAPKLTKPPAITKPVEPVYPPDALAAQMSGDVTLALDLDAAGHVSAATVTKGAGHGFDEAAIEAARQMEFSPAEVDDKPAAIRIAYTIHFVPKVVPVSAVDGGDADGGASDASATDDGEASADGGASDAAPTAATPPPQRLVLRGLARERGTREPLVAADVSIAAGGKARTEVVGATDADGRFEIRTTAVEGLRVVVSDTTHEPCLRDLTAAELAAPTPIEWTCSTARRAGMQYETRVRADPSHAEETKQTLSRQELTTVPGTLGDPLRVIQSLPGVARAPYGLGVLIVRGANPNDTGAFIDTLAVPHIYHFLVGPSVLSPNLVDKIDFFPGGFGVRYGRFSGGLVDVTTRTEVGREVHGSVDLNVLDSSVFVEGPVGKTWRVSAALRRSYIDQLLPLFIPKKVGSSFVTAVPVYYDYQARAERDLAHGGRLVLEAFGADDNLHVISSDPSRVVDIDQHSGSHRLLATLTTPLGPWLSKFRPAYGYGVDAFSFATNSGTISYHRLFLREDLTRTFGPRFTLAAGLDGLISYDLADFDVPAPREGRSIGQATAESVVARRRLFDTAPAVYVEGQWSPRADVRIVPGVRFDYFYVVDTNKYDVDPRLSGRWAITPRLALKGTVGIYHQLPTPQFLDKEFGNPNLSLIWADQYELGVERKLTDAINATLTGFFVRRHDMPVATLDHFASSGKGRAYGLELLLRHEITEHFYGWLAYTLSRSETAGNLVEGVPMGGNTGMERNGADMSWHPSQYDQTHNLSLVGSYNWRAWTFGVRYRLVTGAPTTPVAGSFYDADFNGYTRENGATGSARGPTFSQLDARVERVWTFEAWTFGAYLDVQNVLNSNNPEGTIYDYRFQQSAPLRGLPILPVVGLRGRF